MVNVASSKDEKNILIKKIESVVTDLLNNEENIVITGMFTYIQSGEVIHKESISQDNLKSHPFIESIHNDSNFRNSLVNSKSTEISYDNDNFKEVFKIIIREDNGNEINITLSVTK